MTRINTNISSLTAQSTLAQSNNSLQQALTRLSTGLRINSGKDDPAGLIASESLKSDINATQKAISNSQRANQMIGTADSALGQVSSLLNDIRGLATEAANRGALSDDQIAANQLQVDSSLDAINRIAQTTSFQGKKLLDGSLDFQVGNWTGVQANVSNLRINSANLSSGAMPVSVVVGTAATQASLTTTIAATGTATATIGLNAGVMTLKAAAGGGSFNGYTIQFAESAGVAAATPSVNVDGKTVTVTVNNAAITTGANIKTAFTNNAAAAALFDIANSTFQQYTNTTDLNKSGVTSGGIAGLAADVVFELNGTQGAQVFNFAAGTSSTAVTAAINLAKDSTGITATDAGGTITLKSSNYGTAAFINVNRISGTQAFSAMSAKGADIVATVNGTTATGNGQTLSLNTASLSMSAAVSATGTYTFDVQSGGAMFQLGPDVVGSQQARIGIQSVTSGNIGGTDGRMYQLGSGQSASLQTSPSTAAKIVDEAINQVTSLRGRLGAFQKSTVDSNISSLTDAVQNLSAAQSSIADADFAAESANLTRAQILVQSGTSVLAIANKGPENVLSLLR